MEDFNLHLTGDIHAIGAAHNLAAAFIDNHSTTATRSASTRSRPVAARRRHQRPGAPRGRHRARRQRERLSARDRVRHHGRVRGHGDPRARDRPRATCGRGSGGSSWRRPATARPVTAEDLKVAGAMAVLLKDAIRPNLLQTLEGGPAFVHCGPFGNIAHGNNSILADRLALATTDIVCTEAGFGADMGAEKFFDIKCRASGLGPTPRSSSPRSGRSRCTAASADRRRQAARPGAARRRTSRRSAPARANLAKQIENVRLYGVPVVVAINVSRPTRPRARGDPRGRAGGRRARRGGRQPFRGGRRRRRGAREGGLGRGRRRRAGLQAPLSRRRAAPAKIETIATQIYGADGVDLSPRGGQGDRPVRGAGLRRPADLHGQDASTR